MRILNYQMSAINYVLLLKDICKGVKHYVIKFVNDLQQVNDFIRVFRFLHQ
jgi:hypothetical protein